MSWVAVAVAGGAIVGGVIQAGGARSAANTQAQSGQAAIGEIQREFDINQRNLAPFINAGTEALPQLNNFDITTDPGYQFRLDQGLKGVSNSAAAKGTSLSGATLKELMKYGSDYASGEFNNAFNRNLAKVNVGLSAAGTNANVGSAAANSIANTQTGIGNAVAAGQVGSANAIGGAVSGVGNAFLLSSVLNQNRTPVSPVSSGALDSGMGVG